jgi:hypothetical protein
VTGAAPRPLVGVVVLNWNNPLDTEACLASVARLDYPNRHIIVVDNGSTDDSVARIRRSHPGVELLETGANLGYGEGNNVGIRRALERGAEFVLLLNNDTEVAPSMLSGLVAVAAADPRIGMAGPLVYCREPPHTLFAAGSFVEWGRGTIRHRGMFEPPEAYADDLPRPVDFVAGCGVLVSRALIEACGVLEAKYYLNLEDVEWGVRARRHGFEVVYVPSAVMWHAVSGTLGKASPANTYYMTRNTLLFFWENAPRGTRWLATACIVLRTLRTVAAWSLRSRYRAEAFARRRTANLLALRDFVSGRYGAMGPDVSRVCSGTGG